MEFDKSKTCKGCPDRVADPNCHTTCSGYLTRVEKMKELKQGKIDTSATSEYFRESYKRSHNKWLKERRSK